MGAALICQHATSERDREIAAAMDKRITDESGKTPARKKRRRKKRGGGDDGASGALVG